MSHILQLGDYLEGTTPHSAYYNDPIIRQIEPFANAFRLTYFISCWHMHNEEIPSMWDDFLSEESPDDSIVIRTTFRSLKKCLSLLPIEIGMVKYINHKTETFPPRENGMPNYNTNSWPMIKDLKKCGWENEVRAIASSLYGPLKPQMNSRGYHFYAPRVDLQELIHQIHCHPNASEARKKEIEALFRPAIFPSLTKSSFLFRKESS